MAVLDPLHPVQSSIIEILSVKKGLSAQELKVQLEENGHTISLANLYRTIAQMIDVQILVKNDGKISLNLIWVPHILKLAETIQTTYINNTQDILNFPLKSGERREYVADSLFALDPIWFHILQKFTELPKDHDWYIFNSHPWYSLGMRETETRGYQSIAAGGAKCHLLYGNDTFLDRYGQQVIRVPHFETRIAKETTFLKEGYCLWICDDYILDCIMPDAISKHFAFFFQTVESIGQFDPQLFTDVFHMKARCKITVKRNAKEADRLRSILKAEWEKSEKS